jgi:hypothetical protein
MEPVVPVKLRRATFWNVAVKRESASSSRRSTLMRPVLPSGGHDGMSTDSNVGGVGDVPFVVPFVPVVPPVPVDPDEPRVDDGGSVVVAQPAASKVIPRTR